jgi:hypothetical protein
MTQEQGNGWGQSITTALAIFLVVRVFLSLYAIIILTLRPIPTTPDEKLRPYLGVSPVTEGAAGLLLGPWQRFDALHYQRIANSGYIALDDAVFPPLYPLLARLVGNLAGGDTLLGGLVISNLACVGLFALLHRLVAEERGAAVAGRTVITLAIFPTAFFLLAPYSESLFCLLVVGAFYWGRGGYWFLAGLCAGLAALTRLAGWVLAIPLLFEYLRQRGFSYQRIRLDGLAPFLAPAGLIAFLAFRLTHGMPPISQVYQDYWLSRPAPPWTDILGALGALAGGNATLILALNLATVLLFIALTVMAWRGLPAVYGLYMAVMLLLLLSTSTTGRPLNAMIRYVLPLFPAFMILGEAAGRPWLNRLIVYPSTGLLIYLAGQFVMWGWVA